MREALGCLSMRPTSIRPAALSFCLMILFKDSTQNYSTGIAQTFQEAVNDTTYGVTIVDTIEYAGLDKLQTNLLLFWQAG